MDCIAEQNEHNEDVQEIDIKASAIVQSAYSTQCQQINQYYLKRKHDEALQLGFSSVGFPDDDIDLQQIYSLLQPGFIFEVIVTQKNTEKQRFKVVLQRFLAFCDKLHSSTQKFKSADFTMFSQRKQQLNQLMKINTMNIKATIGESDVVEEFSIFSYYINFDKIQVGDHLNAVLLSKEHMSMSLKNKLIMTGKQWSIQNLQNPSTFDNQFCFRLGYTKQIGLSFQLQSVSKADQLKEQESVEDNLQFKEDNGILQVEYQIKNDLFFPNKQNYQFMMQSLGLDERSSLSSKSNLKSFIKLKLDHRRRLYIKIYCLQNVQYIRGPH